MKIYDVEGDYRTGAKLPVTTWNKERTELRIDMQNGTVDIIGFDRSNKKERTRLTMKRQKPN